MATDVAQLCDFVQTPQYSASATDSNLDWIDLFNDGASSFTAAELIDSVKRKERQPFRSGGKTKGGNIYGVKGLQLTRSKLPWATSKSRIGVADIQLTLALRKMQSHGQILIHLRNPSMRQNRETYFLNSNVSDRVTEHSSLAMSWPS
jgi:hypothetical protein